MKKAFILLVLCGLFSGIHAAAGPTPSYSTKHLESLPITPSSAGPEEWTSQDWSSIVVKKPDTSPGSTVDSQLNSKDFNIHRLQENSASTDLSVKEKETIASEAMRDYTKYLNYLCIAPGSHGSAENFEELKEFVHVVFHIANDMMRGLEAGKPAGIHIRKGKTREHIDTFFACDLHDIMKLISDTAHELIYNMLEIQPDPPAETKEMMFALARKVYDMFVIKYDLLTLTFRREVRGYKRMTLSEKKRYSHIASSSERGSYIKESKSFWEELSNQMAGESKEHFSGDE